MLRLGAVQSLAAYLAQEQYCGAALEAGQNWMGADSVADAEATLAVDAHENGTATVALESPAWGRYVEYVLEAPAFEACDGTLGCGGTRCALRRFAGVAVSALVARGSPGVRFAWGATRRAA